MDEENPYFAPYDMGHIPIFAPIGGKNLGIRELRFEIWDRQRAEFKAGSGLENRDYRVPGRVRDSPPYSGIWAIDNKRYTMSDNRMLRKHKEILLRPRVATEGG